MSSIDRERNLREFRSEVENKHQHRHEVIRETSPYLELSARLIGTVILFGGIGYFVDGDSLDFWFPILLGVGALIGIIDFVWRATMLSKKDLARKNKK
ncbi:MAG: hypothetical protein Kapaf2KO_13860 [Candidatus Kapaibacteriales bacterium]